MEARMGQSQKKLVEIDRRKTNSFRIAYEFARVTTGTKTNNTRGKVRQEERKEKWGDTDSPRPSLSKQAIRRQCQQRNS